MRKLRNIKKKTSKQRKKKSEDKKRMSVFTQTKQDHTQALAFLDPNGGVSIQRFDTLKYKQFDKLTDKQLGFFWRPEEVDVLKDANDFKNLTDHEQHIFTSNLKRQILLDINQDECQNLAPNVEGKCLKSYLMSIGDYSGGTMGWDMSYNIYGLFNLKNSEKFILPIKNFSNKNDALNFTDKLIK